MFASCWSAKGGSGVTVVAVSLAVLLARQPGGALVVDLGGDLPAVLGQPEPDGPGLSDWLAAGAEVPSEGLARLEVAVADGLHLLPRGRGPLVPLERVEVLAGVLAGERRSVVVDCGRATWSATGPADAAAVLAGAAVDSLLVTRPCYLSLRRAMTCPLRPSGVVLLREPGRALGRREVEEVTGADVVAEVLVEPAVARSVDAGVLAARLPRGLERALGRAR